MESRLPHKRKETGVKLGQRRNGLKADEGIAQYFELLFPVDLLSLGLKAV